MHESIMVKLSAVVILPMFLLPSFVVAEEVLRNPFSSSVSVSAAQDGATAGSAEDSESTHYVSPLEREPLHSYQLLGVILSEQLSLALVQSPLGSSHIARVGDSIGNQAGTIQSILVNHILVREGEKDRKLFVGSMANPDGEFQ